MGISSAYLELCRRDGLVDDAAQLQVVDMLQQLQDRLLQEQTLLRRLQRRLAVPGTSASGVPGLYLWGGVGRGKTLLMDLFHGSLDSQRKLRVHFHRMMSDIHAQFRQLRDVEDPLQQIAGGIARQTSVLCFDEFYVSDIGDAMILGRLLDALIRRGVSLVATSNSAPRDLYPNGLQRERFLPAIALIEKHTQVVHIGEGTDYRLRLLQRAGTYLVCDEVECRDRLQRLFHDCAAGSLARSVAQSVAQSVARNIANDAVLDILGRPVQAHCHATDVVWFDFAALCDGPRSAEDYIEIARRFQTVILSGVPALTRAKDDAARRFVALVDEFYDRRVKLIIAAAVPIDRLYQAERLAFEFRRTKSRLHEMQSTAYLHLEHRG